MGKRDEDREISLSIVLKDDGLKALKRNLTHERFYLALKDTSSPGAWTQIWVCIRRLKYERASYSDSTNKPNVYLIVTRLGLSVQSFKLIYLHHSQVLLCFIF